MCPSRNGDYLRRQIFLSYSDDQCRTYWLLHGHSAWDCHAFRLHRFQQNCPLERCLSKQAWNHPGSGIVSISFFSNLFRGQNILKLIWNFPQIFIYRTIWIQWKVCGASNRLPFRPQKDAVTLVFKRWMEGTNGDLNAFSMAFAHFGSSAKNIPTTLLALPHETLMSKHFQREFWTLHFIYS